VVVDASAWLYSLCREVTNCGPQTVLYSRLRHEARERILRYCTRYFATVVFVFDGLYEARKAQVHLERTTIKYDAVKRWYSTLGNWSHEDSQYWLGILLPQLARITLIQVIVELRALPECHDLRLYVADGEADQEIARFSLELGAVVLSNDSDFFLHSAVASYAPLSKTLEAEQHISGPMYSPEDVEKILKIKRDLFPLLAVLAGNDYTVGTVLVRAHRLLGFSGELPEDASRIKKICGVLAKYNTYEEAAQDFRAAPSFGSIGGPRLLTQFEEAMRQFGYQMSAECSKKIVLKMSNRQAVPEEVMLRYRSGLFDTLIMEVLVQHEFTCPVIQEHPDRKSVWGTTRPLRSLAYSCLTLVIEQSEVQTSINEKFFRGSPQKTPVPITQEASLLGVSGAGPLQDTPDSQKIRWLLLSRLFGDCEGALADKIQALAPADLILVLGLRFLSAKGASEIKDWQRKALLVSYCVRDDPSSLRPLDAHPTAQHAHTCTLWENTLLCVLLLLQSLLFSQAVLTTPVATFVDPPVLMASFERLQGRDDWEALLRSESRVAHFTQLWSLAVGTPLKVASTGGAGSGKKRPKGDPKSGPSSSSAKF